MSLDPAMARPSQFVYACVIITREQHLTVQYYLCLCMCWLFDVMKGNYFLNCALSFAWLAFAYAYTYFLRGIKWMERKITLNKKKKKNMERNFIHSGLFYSSILSVSLPKKGKIVRFSCGYRCIKLHQLLFLLLLPIVTTAAAAQMFLPAKLQPALCGWICRIHSFHRSRFLRFSCFIRRYVHNALAFILSFSSPFCGGLTVRLFVRLFDSSWPVWSISCGHFPH